MLTAAERQVGAAPVSPVKARFVSDSGAQLSVVVRPAAEIKPTFLQVGHCIYRLTAAHTT